jgi:hypothetical protein
MSRTSAGGQGAVSILGGQWVRCRCREQRFWFGVRWATEKSVERERQDAVNGAQSGYVGGNYWIKPGAAGAHAGRGMRISGGTMFGKRIALTGPS